MKMNKLTAMILISMLVGILTGHLYRSNVTDPASIAAFASNISILTDIFLRLIKMIIAPLVFSTLVVGLNIPSYERGVARLLRYDRHP